MDFINATVRDIYEWSLLPENMHSFAGMLADDLVCWANYDRILVSIKSNELTGYEAVDNFGASDYYQL